MSFDQTSGPPFLSFFYLYQQTPLKIYWGELSVCVCVCIDIEKSKRENLFERNIESHTRPRGFHSKRDKLLTLIRGCLSLSFSFSLLYIPSIFRFKVLKKRKKEKENDLISAGGRMWPCRERHAIAKGPGHTHTQSFLAPLLLFMKIREPQGVHRSFITLFLISQSCCNEQKNK